jgi:hypothetical protein
MQLSGFKNAEGAAGNSALCEPDAGPKFACPDQGFGPSYKRQATSCKKIFDMKITCGMIPYNLNRKEKLWII